MTSRLQIHRRQFGDATFLRHLETRLSQGFTAQQLAVEFGCSTDTVWRVLRQLRKEASKDNKGA